MGLMQRFKMLLDPATKAKFEQEMREAGRKGSAGVTQEVEKGGIKWGAIFSKMAASLAAAFAVHKIIDFGKASIAAANESDKAWNAIGITLQNNGSSLDAMRGRLDALGETFLRTTRFGDEAAINSANTYIQITGDVANVEKGVAAAADLAAARHLDLEQATVLVARAMNGNTTALKRMGIEIPKNSDAIAILQQRFGGAAKGELNTFAGKTQQLGQYFGELKEEIGHAMIAAGEGSSIMDTFSGIIAGATNWVKENRDMLSSLGKTLLNVVAVAVKAVVFYYGNLVTVFQKIGEIGQWAFKTILTGWQKLNEMAAKAADFLGMKAAAMSFRANAESVKGYLKDLEVETKTRDAAMKVEHAAMGASIGTSVGGGVETASRHLKKLESDVKQTSAVFKAEVVKLSADIPALAEQAMGAFQTTLKETIDAIDQATKQSYSSQFEALKKQLRDSTIAYHDYSEEVIVTENMTTEQRRQAFEHAAQAHEENMAKEAMNTIKTGNISKTTAQDVSDTEISEDNRSAQTNEDNTQKRINGIEQWADSMSSVINAIIGIGSAFGIMGGQAEKVLSGISKGISDVSNLAKNLASGNVIGSIISGAGVIGDVIGVVGGIFKGGKGQGRLAANQNAFNQAIEHPGSAQMKEWMAWLLAHSPVDKGGGGQWAERSAQDDAWNLYQRALAMGMTLHQGGVVGFDGTPILAAASMFEKAMRYHSGGQIRGLGSDEVPIIAKVGETVLPRGIPPMNIQIQLFGVDGDNITEKVTRGINEAITKRYQRSAQLSGNAGM